MLPRILEPEVMDSSDDARDYDAMDHAEVNRRFVDDLLAAGLLRDFETVSPGVHAGTEEVRNAADAGKADDDDCPDDNDRPLLSVLDVGTGTAQIPIELCRRTPHVRLMAMDAALSMLQLARLNLELSSLMHRVQLDQTDAKAMHYADAMFDAVICNSIVHHLPEPVPALAEMLRVLKPGGLLFVRDLLRPDDDDAVSLLVKRYAADCNEHQRALFDASLRAALSLDEVQSLAEQLGLDRHSVTQTSDRHWTLVAGRI